MIKTTFSYDEEALIAFFTFHLKRKDKIRWIYYLIAFIFFVFGILVAFLLDKQIFGLLILVASTIMFMVFPSQAKRAAKRTANARFKREPQDIIFTNERIEQHLEKKILDKMKKDNEVFKKVLETYFNQFPIYIGYVCS